MKIKILCEKNKTKMEAGRENLSKTRTKKEEENGGVSRRSGGSRSRYNRTSKKKPLLIKLC